MKYILVKIDTVGIAFQEIQHSSVTRYTDLDGNTLFVSVPTGLGSMVVDADPEQPLWALSDEVYTDPPYIPPVREFSKIGWRRRFTEIEQKAIDRFNATFETHPMLTNDQKDDIRTGLENYKAASVVNADDPNVPAMLGLYTFLGFLADGRAQEILNA